MATAKRKGKGWEGGGNKRKKGERTCAQNVIRCVMEGEGRGGKSRKHHKIG